MEWIIEANDTEEMTDGRFAVIRELVRCKDCEHYFKDHDDCIVTYCCELNHERMRDDFFCADGEERLHELET